MIAFTSTFLFLLLFSPFRLHYLHVAPPCLRSDSPSVYFSSLTGTTLHSARFKTLTVFNSIYGIGPHTARQLYALGLSSLEQLEQYYDVEGAWDDDDNAEGAGGEGDAEIPASIADAKPEKQAESGHSGSGGGLPSPPASEQSEIRQESPALVPEEAEAEALTATSKERPKDIKLRGITTMLDEEDVGAMRKEEIKESWIKIALGLREDLSVKCVLSTLSASAKV